MDSFKHDPAAWDSLSPEEYELEEQREKDEAEQKARSKPFKSLGTIMQDTWGLKDTAREIIRNLHKLPAPPRDYCMLCAGSGQAVVFKKGIPRSVRCPGSYFGETQAGEKRGKLLCMGYPNWQEFERESRDDLCNEIFQSLERQGSNRDKFYLWLKSEYNVDELNDLQLLLVEAVMVRVRNLERDKERERLRDAKRNKKPEEQA